MNRIKKFADQPLSAELDYGEYGRPRPSWMKTEVFQKKRFSPFWRGFFLGASVSILIIVLFFR